ncbi:hypothetical protein Q4Q35_16545 [Flavivirga aquimarina]|uniref:Uncharacterized protein n=1 Tax=Flavivirga aquimarina TaxID=2027862 RepID=A0ABT8WE28_9FLAO|nr:hypothetical protein [Flavivirga aquimarina]MDO5971417.1 hypothetical protein [Flavivirga aquimarina]
MKSLKIYISLCAIVMTIAIHAQEQMEGIQEVTRKAKADLVKVLTETGDQFNFGIKADDIKNSRHASPISYYEINFDNLLNYNQQPMAHMLETEAKKIIPLVTGSSVVTTFSVSNAKQGVYKITELINRQYHDELNRLPGSIKEGDFKGLKIIYVPNLNTILYHIDGKNYTSYKGGNLREPIEDATLLQLLKSDANTFKAKYGSQLKEGKLLN